MWGRAASEQMYTGLAGLSTVAEIGNRGQPEGFKVKQEGKEWHVLF